MELVPFNTITKVISTYRYVLKNSYTQVNSQFPNQPSEYNKKLFKCSVMHYQPSKRRAIIIETLYKLLETRRNSKSIFYRGNNRREHYYQRNEINKDISEIRVLIFFIIPNEQMKFLSF